LPVALARILDRIMADNPITTVKQGMFHFEYRTYPELALREALMNALCHADFRLAGPVLVKQHPRSLEISNPGGFIGGISPANILHHEPAARNPRLVEALARLRLINRSNLGVGRMFAAMLMEGKEPPSLEDQGEAVKVTFRAQDLSATFRMFVAEEGDRGRNLSVDHLLILNHLTRHVELDTAAAAALCQRPEAGVRDVLSEMERTLGYLERGGTGRGTYWTLRTELHGRLAAAGHPERDRRLDWEAAKTRVLSILMQRARRGEAGLSNAEIRQITHLDREQVKRLMRQLRAEGHADVEGQGQLACWVYGRSQESEQT
jgi:ATP-dependent DNA helicase RecG